MTDSHANAGRLLGRRTLVRLIALYLAALISLGLAIWLELPAAINFGLLGATLILALLTAICAGRTVADEQEAIPFYDRPSMSGRDAGMLTLVTLIVLCILCTKLIYPRAWPTTVDEALAVLDSQIDGERKDSSRTWVLTISSTCTTPGVRRSGISSACGAASASFTRTRSC